MTAATPPDRIGAGAALRRQHAALRPAFRAALDAVIEGGGFVMGRPVVQLEEALAAQVGAPHAIAVHSGTDALVLALRAAGVGPGDEVIVPAYTFFATAGAVLWVGATPVLADVDPATLLLDAARVERAVTRRTRAVIPVDLYGQCAPFEEITAALARSGTDRPPVQIEDMAQALGADRRGTGAGALAPIAALSFYPTKNLGALGDGGMLFAADAEIAKRLRSLRDHGSSTKYVHDEPGTNSRLDTLQAAFLLAKLPFLDAWNERRREIAARYDAAFAGLPLGLPSTLPGNRHVYHLYTVRAARRDGLRAHLDAREIETGIHYPRALHQQPALRGALAPGAEYPNAARAAAEVLSLPIYPEMTDSEVDRVVEGVRSFPDWA